MSTLVLLEVADEIVAWSKGCRRKLQLRALRSIRRARLHACRDRPLRRRGPPRDRPGAVCLSIDLAAKVSRVGGVVVRCRSETLRGAAESARQRFSATAAVIAEIERDAPDLPTKLVAQRLLSAATSTEAAPFEAGFYAAAGDALRRLHGGGFDFDEAIGFVEALETAAGIPLPAPEARCRDD